MKKPKQPYHDDYVITNDDDKDPDAIPEEPGESLDDIEEEEDEDSEDDDEDLE